MNIIPIAGAAMAARHIHDERSMKYLAIFTGVIVFYMLLLTIADAWHDWRRK